MHEFQTINTLKACKHDSIRIAKHLCYSQKFIDRLYKAKTIDEVYRIMTTARKEEN